LLHGRGPLKHSKKHPPENRRPEGNAGQFKKGHSGNPGGRPKEVAEFRKRMLAMSPDVAEALEQYIKGPTREDLDERSVMWFSAMAKERVAAIKVWCEFTIPKPKPGDEFDKPMPVVVDPATLTTVGLVSDARLILAHEIKRLETHATMGIPLSETATVRLTECVKQLAVLAEQEKKILDADPFAKETTEELEARVARAH
jgi:hypothetical protein